ncbi:tRNA 5-hydroxyuridine modification protein YegQ [Candidatus Providencia siddallii]|uniref:tRNA hydroxylation protein P n=1 Tax=Candidatus Providencia siddallii TaxID=1715285 RepID=A0ABP1CF70_9GAMM
MLKPELSSPAGSLKNMRYAFAYGADAVYAGEPRYSLRVRNNEFNYKNLSQGIKEAHNLNKKFYIVINIIPHNDKLKTFSKDLIKIVKLKPDALIISDPGLIMITRELFPEIKIHLSVQANTINWASVKFWKQIGLNRIILSRELSINEIFEIKKLVPDIELEVFIHGSLCMAYSGRCLLSSYINKRDSNQGACTNICRWKYNIYEYKKYRINNIENSSIFKNKIINKTFTINNNTSKEYMLLSEDEHGSYIINSKDLCAIKYIEKLIKIGINSFKIEGRTKSFYYCARTAQIYRKAINSVINGKQVSNFLISSIKKLSNRGYTEGFLNRHANHISYQNYDFSHSISSSQQFVGEFTGKFLNNFAELNVKNKFSIGDSLEIMTISKNIVFILKTLKNYKNEIINIAPGDGHVVYLKIPKNTDIKFALLIRNIKK